MLKNYILMSLSVALFYTSMFRLPRPTRSCTTVPLGPPRFKKLVYFVIDGLRYDGFAPSKKTDVYYNNFTFTRRGDVESRTFFSVSSVPTATSCRILGLMTGAPSNVIEEILGFFMGSTRLDSLPDKFAERRMRMYGDEFWKNTFKTLAHRSFSYCGLSKNRLVSNEQLLAAEVMQDKDVDIKFIHTISVDALGHIYGTVNSEMIRDAQIRADALLSEIYDTMDEETLLVVTSDHGVTNEGAHGGCSKYEIGSFCGFYAKTPLELHHTESFIYNREFIEKFYETRFFNSEDDWVGAEKPYRVVHQDDILPTVCYLMGVPAPSNTYGNLIPYLVRDNEAQKILLAQKMNVLRKSESSGTTVEGEDPVTANYRATGLIYDSVTAKSPLLAYLSIAIGLIALVKILVQSSARDGTRLRELVKAVPFVVTTIMVTHSYYSFASEDIAWALTLLVTDFSLPNLVFVHFFLQCPGRRVLADDKLRLPVTPFTGASRMWLYVVLFFLLKQGRLFSKDKDKAKEAASRFRRNCLAVLPQLAYILYSQICSVDRVEKLVYLCAHPSLDSLFVVHFQPTIALCVLFFLRNLDTGTSQATKHLLLALSPYLVNLEKVQQSINYEVFFALTTDFRLDTAAVAAFAYFILPRLYIIRSFPVNSQGRALNLFSLLFCFCCSWVMAGSLVFSYFFFGRFLFVTLFFILDSLIEEAVVAGRRVLKC